MLMGIYKCRGPTRGGFINSGPQLCKCRGFCGSLIHILILIQMAPHTLSFIHNL